MRFVTIFLNNLTRLFGTFWGSSSSISTDVLTSATSLYGTNEILEYNLIEGSSTVTTASAITTSVSDYNAHAYDVNVTKEYVESMDEKEITKLIYDIENNVINLEERPKVLTKKINDNKHY